MQPGERARRGSEDDADALPELALAQALEEAQLHHDPAHPAAREDDGDVLRSAPSNPTGRPGV